MGFEESYSEAFAHAASSPDTTGPELSPETPFSTSEEHANKGTLGAALPVEVLKNNVAGFLTPAEKLRLASTSRFFNESLKDNHAFYNHLRAVLRNEKPLYPLPGNNDASAAATATERNQLTPSEEYDLKHVLALFAAYQAYFKHYLAMHQKQFGANHELVWPTGDMRELDRLFANIQEKSAALPVKLIQGTGLGVLKAVSKYINAFAKMKNENKPDWCELDSLVVKELGWAQKAAGDDIIDLYFRGASMTGESSRDTVEWAHRINAELGNAFALVIEYGDPRMLFALGLPRPAFELFSGVTAEGMARSSQYLMEVLTTRLDCSLGYEVSANEGAQRPIDNLMIFI